MIIRRLDEMLFPNTGDGAVEGPREDVLGRPRIGVAATLQRCGVEGRCLLATQYKYGRPRTGVAGWLANQD